MDKRRSILGVLDPARDEARWEALLARVRIAVEPELRRRAMKIREQPCPGDLPFPSQTP
jgi:hypothetical protein